MLGSLLPTPKAEVGEASGFFLFALEAAGQRAALPLARPLQAPGEPQARSRQSPGALAWRFWIGKGAVVQGWLGGAVPGAEGRGPGGPGCALPAPCEPPGPGGELTSSQVTLRTQPPPRLRSSPLLSFLCCRPPQSPPGGAVVVARPSGPARRGRCAACGRSPLAGPLEQSAAGKPSWVGWVSAPVTR